MAENFNKKIDVIFEGGESRENPKEAANFMLATCEADDGEEVELYAEVSVNTFYRERHGEDLEDALEEAREKSGLDEREFYECKLEAFYREAVDMEEFDRWSEPLLKQEILSQAAEKGIPESNLIFS